MIKTLALIFVAFSLFRCIESDDANPDLEASCSTRATILDLTGLDGCGFVFQLEDGSRLEPLRVWYCGTPPVPQEQMNDPLANYQLVNGKNVFIDYEIVENFSSACMVGQTVRITCIAERQQEAEN
jgi:hypothetical protein